MIGDAITLVRSARGRRQAVPAFNIDSIDMAMAVIAAAEEHDTGFILQVTAETLDIWGWEFLSQTLLNLVDQAAVPVALMLDHAKHLPFIIRAVDLGFHGVMYDGSALPLEENIANTQAASQYAKARGCFVEGEVGHVARDGEPAEWEHLTTVDEAARYFHSVEIDALAVAVGSKHGHYRSATDINIDRVREIFQEVQAPLVLHGGSGLPVSLFSAVIQGGVSKVNIGTELRRAWWSAMRESGDLKPREALREARKVVAERAGTIIAQIQGKV